MPEVEPLSGDEIMQLRNMLKRRTWVLRAVWTTIGTAIGGAIIAALMR